MRKTFLLSMLLAFSILAKATECVDRIFHETKVDIYLCQNYSSYHETTAILFKARTKILNDYILQKIKTGALKDKKIEIQIYDQVLTYTHLELTQSKYAYYVTLSGFPTLKQLETFVNYFTKPDWKPFLTSDNEKVSSEIIAQQIEKFYAANAISNSLVTQTHFPVWTNENLHLDYANDSLKYFVDSIALNIQPTSSLPVRINDRFLLFQSDSIFVLQRGTIIQRVKIDEPIQEDYDNYAFNKWVNICNGGPDNWLYSYSYDKNRFYKRQ